MTRHILRLQIIAAKYGLGTIRVGFLSVLVFCVVVFLITITILSPSSQRYPTPALMEMEMKLPPLKTGWNRVFERNLGHKWLVTVGKTGSNISRPLQQKGYTIVFVPDRYYQEDKVQCKQPDCVYLDPRKANAKGHSVMGHLSPSSYSRRLIGYLYAISQGADIIYTRNIYNHDSRNPSCRLYPHNTYTVMEYTLDKRAVEELRRLDFNITLSSTVPWYVYHKYVLRYKDCGSGNEIPPTPSLNSSNVDISPHRASHSTVQDRLQSSVNRKNTDFTVLDSSLASFKYVSFWGLVFHTFYGNLGKVLTERLLREIDITASLPREFTDLLFDDLPWKHEGNSHARTHTPEQIAQLHAILHTWKCDDGVTLFQCVRDITHVLVRAELLKYDDMKLINLWLDDLLHIGYQEPMRFKHQISEIPLDISKMSENQYSRTAVQSNHEQLSIRPGQITLSKYCPHLTLKSSEPVMEDIGLIITFNEPRYYSNIALLESMYRGYFKHIIFCGPAINSFTRESTDEVDITHYIFIEAFKPSWYFFYDCLMLAGQLNIDVEGFIQIGDDTLLNPWNLKPLPRNKMWLHKGLDYLNVSLEKISPEWAWWDHAYGKRAVSYALNEITIEASFATEDNTFRTYVETYMRNSYNFTYIYRQGCDFMYVSRAYMNQYIKIANIFQKHNVMTELAHATIVMGLQSLRDMVLIEDGSLWSAGERAISWLFFRESRLFLHPFKIDAVTSNKHVKDFLCNTYMQHSESHL